MAEQQGIQVSRSRINDILIGQQQDMILQLQQRIAELTAVNEALMERLDGNRNGATSPQALSEAIDGSPNVAPTT